MKISVLTPSFNSAAYLEKAIRSVLSQSYTHWEHIVVDGGSEDATQDILKTYDHLHWVSEKDHGQSDAMNKAFQMASGDLIVYLNADDYFYPDTFAHIAACFQEKPEAEIVVANLDIYREETQLLEKVVPSPRMEDILDYRKYRFPLNPVSYFYRSSVQQRIGPFPIENHFAMDYWFLLRAYHYFQPEYLPINAGCFVMSAHNKSNFVSQLDAYAHLQRTLTEFLSERRSATYCAGASSVMLGYQVLKWQNKLWQARLAAGKLKKSLITAIS